MTREELKTLGLSDEQTEAVMKSHGIDIEKFKGYDEKFQNYEAENKALKDSQANYESQIKDLTEKVKRNSDLEAKVKEMTDSLANQKNDFEQRIKTMKIDSAIDGFLNEHKAKNKTAVKSLIDMTKVGIGEDGKVNGLNEQWDKIFKGNEYMFDNGNAPQAGLNLNQNSNNSPDRWSEFEKIR